MTETHSRRQIIAGAGGVALAGVGTIAFASNFATQPARAQTDVSVESDTIRLPITDSEQDIDDVSINGTISGSYEAQDVTNVEFGVSASIQGFIPGDMDDEWRFTDDISVSDVSPTSDDLSRDVSYSLSERTDIDPVIFMPNRLDPTRRIHATLVVRMEVMSDGTRVAYAEGNGSGTFTVEGYEPDDDGGGGGGGSSNPSASVSGSFSFQVDMS